MYKSSAEPLATFKMYEHKPYVECLYSSLILGRRHSFRTPFQLICSYMYKILTWISNLYLQKPSVQKPSAEADKVGENMIVHLRCADF